MVESRFAHLLWTECGYRGKDFPKYESFSVLKEELDKEITCRTCRKVLELKPLPKEAPRKVKWIAQFQGDSKPWANDVDWPELEFEVSVVRKDYEQGINSAGWAEKGKKIILFTDFDDLIENGDDIEYFLRVAEIPN